MNAFDLVSFLRTKFEETTLFSFSWYLSDLRFKFISEFFFFFFCFM